MTLTDGREAAAFFDLDRTLIAGASTFVFGWVAWRKDLIRTRDLLGDAASAISFRLSGGSDDQSDMVPHAIGLGADRCGLGPVDGARSR